MKLLVKEKLKMKNKIISLLLCLSFISGCSNNTQSHTCTLDNDYGGFEVIITEDNDVVSKEEYTFYYNQKYLDDFEISDFRSAYKELNEYYLDKIANLKKAEYDAYYTSNSVVIKYSIDLKINSIDDLYEAGLLEENQVYDDHVSYSASKNLFNLQCDSK